MRRAHPCLLLAPAWIAGACGGTAEPPPPHGEALLVVDTDLPAPRLASRMRVDLYSEDGRWFESRDIGRPDPRDWPASFSVFSDDDHAARDVLVRVRVYPEGVVRDYDGERFEPRTTYTPPRAARSLAELCATAPELPLGGRITLRSGWTKLTDVVAGEGCEPAESGSVAARVTIPTTGTYRFDVADVFPYTSFETLVLRSRCDEPSSQLACRTEPRGNSVFTPGHLPRFDATLEPGTYWLMTVGFTPHWPADVTLEAIPVDGPLSESPPLAGDPLPTPTAPRLQRAPGAPDETPRTEPLPTASVDRLLLLHLVPGVRGRVRVTLRGSCAGTMAKLGADPTRPDPKTAETCIDTSDVRVPLVPLVLEEEMTRPYDSLQGSFGLAEPCEPPASAADPAVCVPGGAFLLGSRLVSAGTATAQDATPERIAFVRRFWMDRFEVTVARFRDAVARGLAIDPTRINFNEHAIPAGSAPELDDYCSWSSTPRERESFAVTCINWDLARAFCRMHGGDLPTEAQWEYAAGSAGRPGRTLYPWGDEQPTCDRVVTSRGTAGFGDSACIRGDVGLGPVPVDATATTDVTPLGIVGLAGGSQEWTLDSGASYASDCWRAAPLVDPSCYEDDAPMRIARGSGWLRDPMFVSERVRLPPGIAAHGIASTASGTPSVGFRCVYPERPR